MSIYHATFNILGINLPQQNLMATSPNAILALLTFIIPVLINLIDLKFQKEVDSVFQAHPITTHVAIIGLLVFVLTSGIGFTFHSSHLSHTCAAVLRTTIVCSGSLSLASLASLLFPDSWRPLIYLIYALLSLGSLHRLVRKWCEWVHLEIMDKLQTLFIRMQQWHMRSSPATLPLTNMDPAYRVHAEGRVEPQVA